MKLLIIIGSNRKGGTSNKVLSLIKNHLGVRANIQELWLKDYNITFCDADNACHDKDCIIQDGTIRILDFMLKADAILYMPVMHAYGTNSRFQAFLERIGYGYLRNRNRPLKDKIASVVVVGRRYGHLNVFSQIVLNIMLNKMIMIGSGFPVTFQTQFTHDSEAEESLKSTLDRMHEFYLKMKIHEVRNVLDRKIIEEIRKQTG